MSNPARLGVSALLSVILSVAAYMMPLTFMLYFFAPGFWLGEMLPPSLTNNLGGRFFPVIASAVVWTLIIFLVWSLLARRRR